MGNMTPMPLPSDSSKMDVNIQTIPELKQFVVPNVRPTGRELGRGVYGTVEEVEIPGATCAAKIIHETLLRMGNEDEVRIVEEFVRECCLMSSLRHPHVVQFLGVCFLPGSRLPALVMEKLVVSLHELLETTPDIPLPTKCSTLHDVARGLAYLHSHTPPVIHRNLTAKNMLLSSGMVAKLADVGVAHIVDICPCQLATSFTQFPGRIVYMPPEVLEIDLNYDIKVDIFSFVNLALFTLTQVFPVLKAPNYIDRTAKRRIARSEIERRLHYIQQIHDKFGQKHVLVGIVEHCLEDLPEDRPSIAEVVQLLAKARTQNPDRYEEMTKLQLVQEKQSLQLQLEDLQYDIDDLQERLQQSKDAIPTHFHPIDMVSDQQQNPTQPQQLGLKWQRYRSVQWNVGDSSQIAILDGSVYLRGAESTILVYNPADDQWKLHCSAPDGVEEFAMTVMNGQLILAGGVVKSQFKNKVAIWNVLFHNWQYPYPPMPTARSDAQLVSYQHYLMAVGGVTYPVGRTVYPFSQTRGSPIVNVEILDTSRLRWYIAESLPKPCNRIQSVCISDTLYLLEDSMLSSDFYRASLPTLISFATSKRKASTPTWERLPILRNFHGLVSYENSLLAIGSHTTQSRFSNRSSTDIPCIHAYNADTNEWTNIGDLPTAFHVVLCVVLPSREFFVFCGKYSFGTPDCEAYIGTQDYV